MSKTSKIILFTFLFLIIAIGAAGIILPDLLETKLRDALIGEFSEQTEKRYELDLKSINISLWSRKISANSIVVTPTSDSLELRKVEASSILIDGIKWRTLLTQRFPEFRSVSVTNPDVELYSRRISSAKPGNEKLSDSGTDIVLSTFDIFITGGTGKVIERSENVVFSLGSFDLSAREVNLNTLLQGAFVPYLQDLSLQGTQLFWNLEDDFYHFTIDEFAFNKESKMGRIHGLAFTPIVPKYDFAKYKGKQLDRFDLTVESIQMENINLDSLFVPAVNLSKITIENADLEVFHDKHMPPGPTIRYKPLLHDVSKKLGFSFGIEELEIKNSRIAYGEHLPGSELPGYISFENLNASLTNFYTIEHPNYYSDSLRLDATTEFIDVTTLSIDLAYATFDDQDTHTLKASLKDLNGTFLNDMLINTAFTRVDRGYIHNLEIDLKLDTFSATGKMLLEYENLKITVLDENDATNTNFKTRLKSFLANNFVMNTDNFGTPTEIDYQRPKDKAIFGYWWKSIQSGLEDTIK